jgi:hypothetical protein
MFLGLLTLITALVISGVAVYYSVSGLAAIFAGAAVPIIIMGASLEIGKLVTASWLHRNWKTAPFMLKSYLMIATLILMFITSMGIFGFLSRAHVEQGAPVGDVAAQIELIDEKINAKRSEIEQAKTATKNLDDVVAQYMLKGKDERSVAAANNARKNQQKERDKLAKDIDNAQKEISKLQEIKLPLTTQIRKIETEVGPIKYIAEFMYGSNADKNMLERAVTWMILIIIFVFDPLAVLLLIAGQISLVRASELRRAKKAEKEAIKTEALATVMAHHEPEVKHVEETLDREKFEKETKLAAEIAAREAIKDMPQKIEKGEITLDADPQEKPNVLANDRNNDPVLVDTVSEPAIETVRVDDNPVIATNELMADSSISFDVPVVEVTTEEVTPVEENLARWQELEEQVANLKKKEQYMMKVGNQQISVEKK